MEWGDGRGGGGVGLGGRRTLEGGSRRRDESRRDEGRQVGTGSKRVERERLRETSSLSSFLWNGLSHSYWARTNRLETRSDFRSLPLPSSPLQNPSLPRVSPPPPPSLSPEPGNHQHSKDSVLPSATTIPSSPTPTSTPSPPPPPTPSSPPPNLPTSSPPPSPNSSSQPNSLPPTSTRPSPLRR